MFRIIGCTVFTSGFSIRDDIFPVLDRGLRMSLPITFSLFFFAAFAVYIFLGLFVFFRNTNNSLNRVFFLLCLSLCVWAFCFSVVNSAADYRTALLWRQLSAVGWGIMHSFSLHFLIILTGNKGIFKKKWLYIPLYLPAAFNLYIFGIGGILSGKLLVYRMVLSAAGWVNQSLNALDWYFNVYFVSFALIGFWLLFRWGKKSADPQIKKQARLLLTAYGTAMVWGAMTDNVLNLFLPVKVPQMAVVITLIPILSIVYLMIRYKLMEPETVHKTKPGHILSESSLAKFYDVLSLVFILGGILNFAALYFFFNTPLLSVMSSSFFMFAYGIIIRIIRYISRRSVFQETVMILLVSAAIPLITLRFIDSAAMTVWAIAFIFLMLSVVYNRRRMMYAIAVSFLATQIIIWIYVPEVKVLIDASDHIAIIGIFGITFWLAHYVNHVYIQRLKENELQISFQKMVLQISADFGNASASNLDEKINAMLKLCGEYFQVDRTFFISMSRSLKTHEWENENIHTEEKQLTQDEGNYFLWWKSQLINNEMIDIPDADMLPADAEEEKIFLRKRNIKSLIALSLTNKSIPTGLLFFASVKDVKIWREDHKELLRMLANMLSDVISKVESEKEISYMAYYDSLTGLPNRTLYLDRLEQAIESARRTGKIIGVVFVDLDSFKAVNDTVGHPGGDELLIQMANRLSGSLRKHDTVSRFGGDEYLILLTQIEREEDVQKIADKIMRNFVRPVTIFDQEFYVTASSGIAVFPTDGEDADTLIKNADLAMYISKENGKNQSTLFSSEKKDELLQKTKLSNSLYRALERNELELYYQPQVEISSGKIVGCEALLRWHHPDQGMISPAIFIPMAEKTGLIDPIGKWVIQTACRQNKMWQDMGLPHLQMAVNLSVEQFRNKDFVEYISGTLQGTGLESRYLELEITESTIMFETDYIISVLEKLQQLGVNIALDDFGTYYSSLSRLKTIPLDRLKIDMQFVHGISENNKDEAIAKTIIQLARNLSLSVTAEGVETGKQYAFFKQERCDLIQGFFFFKPMPASEMEAVLIEQNKN